MDNRITGTIADEVLNACGLDVTELVYQVDDANELLGMGTMCGAVGNKSMTEEVVTLLNDNKKGHVYVVFSNDEGIQAGIIYMMARVKIRMAERIADLVYASDGSFRPESEPIQIGGINGYIAFESE